MERPRRLVAPSIVDRELAKHETMLRRRAGLSPDEYDALYGELSRRIAVVDDRLVLEHWNLAWSLLDQRDHADVAYLATALATSAAAIWSFDHDYDAQDLFPRITRLPP